MTQGSTNVPSSSPGQVDFLAGQVTFKAYDVSTCPNGQRSKEVILQLKNLRAACPKENPAFEFLFFSSPDDLGQNSTKFPNFTLQKDFKRQGAKKVSFTACHLGKL